MPEPPENSMLRKLIMLAITSGLAKKLYMRWRRRPTPFPTAANHPARRNRVG
jgi:hypothetical protein